MVCTRFKRGGKKMNDLYSYFRLPIISEMRLNDYIFKIRSQRTFFSDYLYFDHK
jgi:hypothetical protein